jgi:hypothetical protein
LQGDIVEDAHVDIVRATPAPYLDRGEPPEEAVGEATLGTLEVPADYDQDALEQSVETAIARLDAAAALQDAVAETAAQYVGELQEKGPGYQQ